MLRAVCLQTCLHSNFHGLSQPYGHHTAFTFICILCLFIASKDQDKYHTYTCIHACCVFTLCCHTHHCSNIMCVSAYPLQICLDSLVLWALDRPHTPCPPSSGCWSRSPRSPTGISGHHGLALLPAPSSPFLGPLVACVASLFLPRATISTPDQSKTDASRPLSVLLFVILLLA